MKNITIIGNGSMALNIAKGLKDKYHLEVVGRDMSNIELFEKKLNKNIDKYLISDFDITDKIIILCVKPENIKEVSSQIKGKANIFISVLAGITLETINKNFKYNSRNRVMPNIFVEIKESLTLISGDENDDVSDIFNTIGKTLWIEEEKMNIATALSGSGPAFLAHISNTFTETGVSYGLSEEEAKTITTELFKGFGSILKIKNEETIIKEVSSPNGTTEAGLNFMEDSEVDILLKRTIYKAYEKSMKID